MTAPTVPAISNLTDFLSQTNNLDCCKLEAWTVPMGHFSILPKRFEALRRQLGVAHRVLDVLVPEIVLHRAHLCTGHRVHARRAILYPPHMQEPVIEVN